MPNENNNSNKDVANSLNKYNDIANKGTNAILDSANQINNWYADQINKMSEGEIPSSRLETNVDNSTDETIEEKDTVSSKIETKVEEYDELQTNNKNKQVTINNTSRIKTKANENEDNSELIELESTENELGSELTENSEEQISNNQLSTKKTSKMPKRIATAIKGAKLVNNTTHRVVKTGKSINTALNEGGLKSFENSSSRIMTKPITKVANKVTSKATNKLGKASKKVVKTVGKKAAKTTANAVVNATKLAAKLVMETMKLFLSMLPQIAPIIIILMIIAAIGNFLNFGSTKEADDVNFDEIADMMIVIEDENLQKIYNEFLKNIGTPYLMDHSNLKYDECMDYYDCSSWVIHCLAHTGIKTIPNTGAQGIYNNYCNPIEVNERKAGDLIFLKDTYDTGDPGSISHIGIFMGELTINGETAEWVIDTGSNPSGVRIRRYDNGWWNGSNFYGFARLKE